MSLTVLYWLLVVVMLIGVAGAILPGIPGASLVVIGIIVWGFFKGFNSVVLPLVVSIVVLLLSVGIDFLATYWGAQRAGASRWGQIGAVVGLFLGVFGLLPAFLIGGPFLGILVGPILGAFIGEFLYRKELELEPRAKQAINAAVGIVVGSLVGRLIQGALAFVTVLVFLFTTWSQVYGSSISLSLY